MCSCVRERGGGGGGDEPKRDGGCLLVLAASPKEMVGGVVGEDWSQRVWNWSQESCVLGERE